MTLWTDLTPREQKDFLAKVRDLQSDRKRDAKKRIDIYTGQLAHYVKEEIRKTVRVPHIKAALLSLADNQPRNALREITLQVAGVPYNVQPQRLLEDETAQDRLTRLLKEVRTDFVAQDVLNYAFVANVAITLPRVIQTATGLRMRVEIVLPDRSEVITNKDFPEEIDVLGYINSDGTLWVVDAFAWYLYDEKGDLAEEHPHGMGVFPGAVCRLDHPCVDFWSHTVHQTFAATSIRIGTKITRMAYRRMKQQGKIMVLTSDTKNLPPQQAIDPDGPLHIPQPDDTETPAPRFEVLDYESGPQNDIAEINFYISCLMSEVGLESSTFEFGGVGSANFPTGIEVQRDYGRLAEVRDRLIQWQTQWEREHAWKVALAARAAGHPLAVDPEQVRENFRMIWAPLSTPMSPQDKIALRKEEISLGLRSPIDEMVDMYPGITRDEAKQLNERNLTDWSAIWDFMARHNTPSPENMPTEPQTLPQIQGRQGGQRSGEVRRGEADGENEN